MKVMMVGVVGLTVLVTAIFVVRSRQEEMQAVRPRGGHPGNPGGASSPPPMMNGNPNGFMPPMPMSMPAMSGRTFMKRR